MKRKEVVSCQKKIFFKPKKSLGQNFLFNKEKIEEIVKICSSFSSEEIFEIGPGYGSLTKVLLDNFKNVYCFEKDKNLYNFLKKNFSSSKNLKIFLSDFLDIKWKEFFKEIKIISDKINIVGNLPYNFSNKILSKIISEIEKFKNLTFLVQKEVAQRWTSSPFLNKSQYSYLSVLIEYFFERSLKFEISKSLFFPAPKVDGAVVNLKVREKFLFSCKKEEKRFLTFVKNCFKFRRKTLLNNVNSFCGDKIEKFKETILELNYYEKVRPQQLWISDYVKIYNYFSKK